MSVCLDELVDKVSCLENRAGYGYWENLIAGLFHHALIDKKNNLYIIESITYHSSKNLNGIGQVRK
jgi:hypothetical protein